MNEPIIHKSILPFCPHCHEPDNNYWDGLEITIEDGSEWLTDCPFCGNRYKVACCITTTFRTEKTND